MDILDFEETKFEKLICERHEARKKMNFKLSDKLKKEIQNKKYEVQDKKFSEKYVHEKTFNTYEIEDDDDGIVIHCLEEDKEH